jgi:hypothetical protein
VKSLKKASSAKTAKSKGVTKAKPRKAPRSALQQPVWVMPREIKDWIERAQSIMGHQRGEIDRLKAENADLKAYRKFAETRLLRSDHQ